MIQKNVFYHASLMHNVALVAQARMIPLSQLHDQILRDWLESTSDSVVDPPGNGPDQIGIYMQESTLNLIELRMQQDPKLKTYSDVIRTAFDWWLKTMSLDKPLNPMVGNG